MEHACNRPWNILYPSRGNEFPKCSTKPGPRIAPGEEYYRYPFTASGGGPTIELLGNYRERIRYAVLHVGSSLGINPANNAAVRATNRMPPCTHITYTPNITGMRAQVKNSGFGLPGMPGIEVRFAHHVAESGCNFESMYLSRNCTPRPDFRRKRKPEARAFRRCLHQRVKPARGLE